jgi:hypothetical protein
MTISDLAAVSVDNRFWLQWMLWGLLMSLVMGWVARSRSRSRHAGSAQRLQPNANGFPDHHGNLKRN